MADTILRLSADSGAQIRYTLDKSEPTQDSTLYSSQVSVPEGAVLKAKSFRSGYLPSDTMIYRNQIPSFIWTNKGSLNKTGDIHQLCYDETSNTYFGRWGSNSYFSKSNDLINWEDLSSYNISNVSYFTERMISINGIFFLGTYNYNSDSASLICSRDLINWSVSETVAVEAIHFIDVVYFNGNYIVCLSSGTKYTNTSCLFSTTDGISLKIVSAPTSSPSQIGIYQNKFWYNDINNNKILMTNDLQTWETYDYKNNIINQNYSRGVVVGYHSDNFFFLTFQGSSSSSCRGYLYKANNPSGSNKIQMLASNYYDSQNNFSDSCMSFYNGIIVLYYLYLGGSNFQYCNPIGFTTQTSFSSENTDSIFNNYTLFSGNVVFKEDEDKVYKIYNNSLYELSV